jgi:hypothetical protein
MVALLFYLTSQRLLRTSIQVSLSTHSSGQIIYTASLFNLTIMSAGTPVAAKQCGIYV